MHTFSSFGAFVWLLPCPSDATQKWSNLLGHQIRIGAVALAPSTRRCSLSILNVTPRGVERGELSRLFQKGQAVILNEDERISRRSEERRVGQEHRARRRRE